MRGFSRLVGRAFGMRGFWLLGEWYGQDVSTRIERGVTMAVFGVVAVLAFVTGGSIFGAVFVGVGVAVFGWGMTRRGGRQVSGTRCADCLVVVTLEHESEICPRCSEGLHARCLAAHIAKTHAAQSRR